MKDEGTPDLLIDEGSAGAGIKAGPIGEAAYVVGSIGLILATCVDSIAVAGRHLGFRLLGSIELIQVAVVLLASAAMIVATAVGSHASVHILTERLKPRMADALARGSSLLNALFFLLLASGSAWVAYDLWGGHEQTELLAIPLGWFRILWIGATLLIAALFAHSLISRRS